MKRGAFIRTLRIAALAALVASCDHSTAPAPGATGPAKIVIASILSLGLHAPYQIAPVVLDSAGKDITQSVQVHWTSSDATIASVSDSGLVTGVALGGPVTITGSAAGLTASTTLSVVPADILITPVVRAVQINTTQQLTALPRDFYGAPISAPIVWASLSPDVATVDPSTGSLAGVGLGDAVVTATSAGRTASFGSADLAF